jgi:DNA-binding NarL/FixJ family response regulator
MTSVLIVDDHALRRMGFRLVLESEAGISVAGEAENGHSAVRRAAELSPDVVLMDIRMPGMDGIEATRRITETGGRSRVLVLTTFDLDEYVYAALQAGASGFLLKDARPDELLAGIRAVASGDAVVAPALTRKLMQTFTRVKPDAVRRAAEDPRLQTLT